MSASAEIKEFDFEQFHGRIVENQEIYANMLSKPLYEAKSFFACKFRGEFLKITFNECRFRSCSWDGILGEVTFQFCRLESCSLSDGDKYIELHQVYFDHCHISDCGFRFATLVDVNFLSGYLGRNWFIYPVSFQDMRIHRVKGLATNRDLHTARVEGDRAPLDEDLRNAPLPLSEKFASWERLRTFGRLPLFGVSFSALVSIPVVAFLLGAYNEQVGRLHKAAGHLPEQIDLWSASHSEQVRAVGALLKEHLANLADSLHPIPIPSLTFWLLISTLFLGTGSMLYSVLCPPRINEFSLERWVDELGRPALQYLPLSWSHRRVRLVAGVCYLVGGFGTLLILVVKLWNAGAFVIENTSSPWWWW